MTREEAIQILTGDNKATIDTYINKYSELKLTSTGSKKQLAKLFLNNLYGKMATSTNSSLQIIVMGVCANLWKELRIDEQSERKG